VTVSAQQIDLWLVDKENEHLEFKEAKQSFHFEKLVKYCAALANERGGSIVLGITDQKPRRVVGTSAFRDIERTKAGLVERLRLRVDAHEVQHSEGRVLVFTAPARPIGVPIPVEGAYWMRAGDDLAPMTPDMLRRIFDEAGPDFSSETCPGSTLADLDPAAVDLFRKLWQRKSGDQSLAGRSNERLLVDAELVVNRSLNYAAVIMLGTRDALGRHLGQAEIVFEYRSGEAPGPASERREFRQGFLPVLDEIWKLVNLRNDVQHFQQGLFVLDVPTFQERAVREAMLNAVTHRDYRHAGSVFVRQYPRRIEIVSPGGFPPGIDESNLLWEQNPRNRRIAEVLGRCGLVERAGQGFDWIYRDCIAHGKPLPDFSRTGEHSVWVTLHGEIQDAEFLRFLEAIGRERIASFDLEDLLVIDLVHRDGKLPPAWTTRAGALVDLGVIERVGRGRGARYLLSRRFYRSLGRPGTYTRRKGLDRATNKALLVKHIEEAGPSGASLAELQEVLPSLSRDQVRTLLRELRQAGQVEVRGNTRAGRWYLRSKPNLTQ